MAMHLMNRNEGYGILGVYPQGRWAVVAKDVAPCCKRCDGRSAKYFSVDVSGPKCGEACMLPALYPLFKIFEPNLTRCAD